MPIVVMPGRVKVFVDIVAYWARDLVEESPGVGGSCLRLFG